MRICLIACLALAGSLAGCGVQPAAVPPAAAVAAPTPRMNTVRRLPRPPHAVMLWDVGLEMFIPFEVKSLPDMEVTYWQETYRNGELVENLSWGETYSPAPGTPVEKGYRWSLYRPAGDTSQIRLNSGMDEDRKGFINDPFVGYSGPTWISEEEEWHVPAGQPQLIWYAFWQPEEQKSIGWDARSEEGLKKLPLVILVKCEFRPAVPNRRGIEVKAFSGLPKDSKE